MQRYSSYSYLPNHQRNFSCDEPQNNRYNQQQFNSQQNQPIQQQQQQQNRPTQLMRRYLEKGNEINKISAAGRPVLFPAQQIAIPSNLQAVQGKKRYMMPQNEIDQLSIFRPPNDEFRPDNRQYAQFDYDRNLMTDDIDGARSGTRKSPVLKNILRAKELAEFNRNPPFSFNQLQKSTPIYRKLDLNQMQVTPQQQHLNQMQMTPQQQHLNQMQMMSQQQHQQYPAIQPSTTQMRAGQHILYNGQLIMNDNLPNEHGFQGFESMGKKNHSVQKFGSGLKEMGLI